MIVTWLNNNEGLSNWIAGIGNLVAILFVYWQLKEQQKEFNESNKIDLQIAFNQQFHAEKTDDGGNLLGDIDYYIWAVNNGSKTSSFKFLGFCRGDDISKIDKSNVIIDPKHYELTQLLPHKTNDFELLQPGKVSNEYVVSSKKILSSLHHPDSFFVIYMNATGKIFKREVLIR